MDGSAFSGINAAFYIIFITLCITFPLGLWKLVEIVIWLIHHIHIVIK